VVDVSQGKARAASSDEETLCNHLGVAFLSPGSRLEATELPASRLDRRRIVPVTLSCSTAQIMDFPKSKGTFLNVFFGLPILSSKISLI